MGYSLKDLPSKDNFLKLVQSAEFEGRMAHLAGKAVQPARRRLARAGYYLSSGIWSGDKLAQEYRTILMNGSSRPAIERMYIRAIGDAALQALIDKAEAEEKNRLATPARTVKRTSRKTTKAGGSGQ